MDNVSPLSVAGALRGLEIFRPLTEEQLQTLSAIVRRERFARGQQLYDQGEASSGFMVVGAGQVEARRQTPFGDQRVASLGPGDLVGEISVVDGKPRSSTVVAIESGHVWRFDSADLSKKLASDPKLELALLGIFCRTLAGKIRQANHVMSQIMAPGEKAPKTLSQKDTGSVGELDVSVKRALIEEQGVASDEMKRLADFSTVHCFASGDIIFSEGDPCDSLYIIAEGNVRISRRIPTLGEEALAIFQRGEVFGEMAWIDREPRSADAIAHTGGCTVLAISREQLDGSIDHDAATHARFLKTLSAILCRRLRHMNDQLVAYRTMVWF